MPHSCGDLDVPVISVCGSEILMEKLDIQKLIVYATDLGENNTSRTGFWPFRTTDGQIEDWNKKIEPSPLCRLWICRLLLFESQAESQPNPNKGKQATHT